MPKKWCIFEWYHRNCVFLMIQWFIIQNFVILCSKQRPNMWATTSPYVANNITLCGEQHRPMWKQHTPMFPDDRPNAMVRCAQNIRKTGLLEHVVQHICTCGPTHAHMWSNTYTHVAQHIKKALSGFWLWTSVVSRRVHLIAQKALTLWCWDR